MQRIVLNGCFDLLHRGHKYLISRALDLAGEDKVYILVNSDRSVRELKGDERPINTQVLRVFYINEFVREWLRNTTRHPTVNIKVFDSEKELMDLFTEIRPTVIVKGDDRPDVRDILGSDRWPVLIVPRVHDKSGDVISTTSIIDKAIS